MPMVNNALNISSCEVTSARLDELADLAAKFWSCDPGRNQLASAGNTPTCLAVDSARDELQSDPLMRLLVISDSYPTMLPNSP